MKMVGLSYEAFNGYVIERLDAELERFEGHNMYDHLDEWRETIVSVLTQCMEEFKVDKIKRMKFEISTAEGALYPHYVRVVRVEDRFEANWE